MAETTGNFGIGAITFVLITIICLFILNLSDKLSIILGAVGALVAYFIGRRKNEL